MSGGAVRIFVGLSRSSLLAGESSLTSIVRAHVADGEPVVAQRLDNGLERGSVRYDREEDRLGAVVELNRRRERFDRERRKRAHAAILGTIGAIAACSLNDKRCSSS